MIKCKCKYSLKERPCTCGFAEQKARAKIRRALVEKASPNVAQIPKSKGKSTRLFFLSVEFDSPANRIISEFAPKNKFRVDTSLPDLAFLRQLSIQGRLRYFQGSTVGAGVAVTITPNVGETLFIYRILGSASTGAGVTGLTVANDGETRAVIVVIASATTSIVLDMFDSLVGDGIKSFTVENTSATNAQVSVLAWVENTSRIRDVAT